MPVELEGGCQVFAPGEGEPLAAGTVREWRHVGRATGARDISLRILELAPGRSPALANETCEEVLYVLSGRGRVVLNGRGHGVAAGTGIFVAPGVAFLADNPGPGPLVLASSRCPDPGGTGPDWLEGLPAAVGDGRGGGGQAEPPPLVRLKDVPAEATGDRWYKVLVDRRLGCRQVTQFVGAIPPGRSPEHFHEYEEVLCILAGEGRMWAGAVSAPVAPGSCIYLPRRQVHCLENTGRGELRVLGVFYPSGSPAVHYRS